MAPLRTCSSAQWCPTSTDPSQISIVSLGNSITNYVSLAGAQKVYTGVAPSTGNTHLTSKPPADIPSRTLNTSPTTSPSQPSPVTPLSARTFGTWTALSSIIRLYAAYHISNAPIYELALWSFTIAFGHFAMEWLVYDTARWGKGLASPVFVSTGTMVWMLLQWGHYVQ